MRVLIVGGAGYLGGAVTDILSDHPSMDIRIYDNLTYESEYRKPCHFVFGDIQDHDRLKEQLQWAEAVIWLAAIVGDAACDIDKETTININQYSVKWLADNFSGRIIFTSTCSVYGQNDEMVTERSTTNPLSTYAVTKLQAESYLKHSNALIFRLGTLYGLSDEYSRIRLDLVVNTLTAKTHFNNKMTVFGGQQYRPLLHVQDAAHGIAAALTSSAAGVFNIHGSNDRIIDIAETVHSFYPDAHVEMTGDLFEDHRNYRVSSDLFRETTGWEPVLQPVDGVRQLKQLFNDNRIKDPNDARYCNHLYLKIRS